MADVVTETDSMPEERPSQMRSHVLASGLAFDPAKYEFDDSFRPANLKNPLEIHTTPELVAYLDQHPETEVDARVMAVTRESKLVQTRIDAPAFRESFKKDVGSKVKFREGFGDPFNTDFDSGANIVGSSDFMPLLGGPFYKNLYYWQDYIRMHSACYYAYHHDPVARLIVQMTRNFTLGRGYRVVIDNSTPQGKMAEIVWHAFEEANNLKEQIDDCCNELSIYGETMLWKLPNNQTRITYQLKPGEPLPTGIIPRIRLIDPSNIVEIVTYPEDITRRLFYVWMAPTQYQTYTGTERSTGMPDQVQPILKFIYRQIPADQMMHFSVNKVSNEKRGRSDLFPVLGYLKRLRDSTDYAIVALLKQAAWAIDTTVQGSQSDIDAYVASQQALGSIPTAGSEFVHTQAVTRQMLATAAGGSSQTQAWDWILSMIAMGTGYPVSYFGTHHAGGNTRAGAIVGTEPVAKKIEHRQLKIKAILKECFKFAMDSAGLDVDCDIVFPELILQDRSQKLKDLALSEAQNWISPQRAAETAAKEFDFQDFVYTTEIQKIKDQADEEPMMAAPLSTPGIAPKVAPGAAAPEQSSGAVASPERKDVKQNALQL